MTSAESAAPAPSDVPLCARHPERAAMAPCTRCGSFACEACIAGRIPPQCQRCFDGYGESSGVKGVPYSYGSALAGGFSLGARAFVPALLVSLPFGAADYLIGLATGDGFDRAARWGWIISGLLAILADTGRIHLFGQLAHGLPVSGLESFGYALKNFGRMWVVNFRAGMTVLGYTLLLVVPGVIKATRLSVCTEDAVLGEPGDALARSESLTKGKTPSLFGLLMTMWVVRLAIVFVFAFVGGMTEELAPSATKPIELAGAFIGVVAEVFISASFVAAYFGLRNLEARSQA